MVKTMEDVILTIRVPVSDFEHDEGGVSVEGITSKGKEFFQTMEILFPGFMDKLVLSRFAPVKTPLLDLVRDFIGDRRGLTITRATGSTEYVDEVQFKVYGCFQPELCQRLLKHLANR